MDIEIKVQKTDTDYAFLFCERIIFFNFQLKTGLPFFYSIFSRSNKTSSKEIREKRV